MSTSVPWGRVAVVSILVVEVLVLLGVAFSAQGGPATGIAVGAADASITVSDQDNVVKKIVVAKVTAPMDAWVVVQTDFGNSGPGAVIGTALVKKGESRDVVVSLDSSGTLPLGAYLSLVADQGQAGKLEYVPPGAAPAQGSAGMGSGGSGGGMSASKDRPFVANGQVVSAKIRITPLSFRVGRDAASIASASLTATANSVVASSVIAPGPSWLEVSVAGSGGMPGELLGAAQVQAGSHASVVVTLTAPPGKLPLVAVLHVDLGVPGFFEFNTSDRGNSPDQPYEAGGQPVAVPVQRGR